MSIFSKFSGKKKEDKQENVLPARRSLGAGGDLVKDADKTDSTPTVRKENTGRAHRILSNYHLSEKSNLFATTGRYVFKVTKTANKIEVRQAVESVYDVHVIKVNMINTSGKSRRQGRTLGRTQDWKKAIVTLRTGEKISGLAEGV